MKKKVILTGLFFAVVGFIWAQRTACARPENIVVDTKELGPINLNEKAEAKERVVFYEEGNTAVSINDDGDPNVGMKF
jgi:hypothetical protein